MKSLQEGDIVNNNYRIESTTGSPLRIPNHHAPVWRTAITILVSFLMVVGCGSNREEEAGERLQEAISLKEKGNFNLAKLKLDTLIHQYKDQAEYAQRARTLLRQINISEQERNLTFLDSMLVIQEETLQPMLRNFIVSDEYGSEKVFIHRRQRPENSFNRTYLKANLNESGDFFISSQYHGTEWIHHEQIRVYFRGESVSSIKVEEDGFNNRRFEDGQSKWEIIHFKDGKDNGIIDFIATNWDQPLRVQFIGRRHEYIIMEQFDREAIRDGYEISFILKEIQRIKDEREKVKRTLNRLIKSEN
ncbi:outer membrane protein assembly factor BamD [Alkalitalea saponilacus]|uniref:Uncharacterized protein n=1 Tax=Alkalitalea saponilacus TaxID=889453 RepID=A0A1T5HLQ8_9BACT|nr:hypothetical protein [Alkalitalea saponilacus]SKC21618.1 hypothetical protein SAMN03080601_02453 [Alkalitalea saponilacus]